MKRRFDPFVIRLMCALIAVPAAALAFIGLAKLKQRADGRRVLDYVRHVQPQLAADPRFKYIKLEGTFVSGCVSNTEALASLKSFLAASKPPVAISFSLVSTNSGDWTWQEEHQRLLELDREGSALVNNADAFLEALSDRARVLAPANTNFVRTLPEFQAALTSVQDRRLAVISFPAEGYTLVTNQAAEYAAILKQCGFREVRLVVTRWGMTFPYSVP